MVTTGTIPTNMVTDFTYDPTTKLLTQMVLVNADGNNTTHSYSYDSWKRPMQTIEENLQSKFSKNFAYDDFGFIVTETSTAVNKANNRTSTRTLHHTYQNGGLLRLRDNDAAGTVLWELQALNARGQLTQAALGNAAMQQQTTYDSYGLPSEQKLLKSGNESFRHTYTWNAQQGLLTSRNTTLFTHNNQPWAESFEYDNLDRLTQWTDPIATLTQNYDTRGRIETNSAAGNYMYASATTYKQKEITLNAAGQAFYTGHQMQEAVYNNFKQPVEIVEENRDKITFQYNASGGRAHKEWGRNLSGGVWGSARYRKHYSADGSMEITEDAQTGNTSFDIYLGGDAYGAPMILRSVQGSSTNNEFLFLHRDYLGSIVAITDINGSIKEKRHFDAWGNVAKLQDGSGANLSSFIYLQRGYTGHEHLQSVGLIHMNGRLYDPVLHRFLMPDNYVQDPFNSQNFNRYTYVLNNPLRYTDPTGELTEAQWAAAWELVYTTFTTNETPYGGYIEGNMGTSTPFSSSDLAFGFGVGHMNAINGWGGGGGKFAGSAAEAHWDYNRGILTPEIVGGFYQQRWSGQYYNISAGYSPDGRGFNIASTSVPGQSMEVAINYASYEQVQRLMGLNALVKGGGDLLQNAGYAEGAIGAIQIGMLSYRQSLPIESKIGTFGKFSAGYRQLGVLRRVLGPAGNIGSAVGIAMDYQAMKNGEIGNGRFVYRTTGAISTFAISTYIGAQFGGPWGAAAGAGLGLGTFAGEQAYDGYMYWHTEMSNGLGNIESAIRGGWLPRW